MKLQCFIAGLRLLQATAQRLIELDHADHADLFAVDGNVSLHYRRYADFGRGRRDGG